MDAALSQKSHHIPAWLIKACKRSLKICISLWSLLFTIIVGVFTSWLFTPTDSDYRKLPIVILSVQYRYIEICILLCLTTVMVVAWAISKLEPVESPQVLQQHYLTRKVLQTQELTIEGISQRTPHVKLAEIFIPLHLRPHLSNIDQLLTAEQQQLLRRGIQSGELAPEVEKVRLDAEKQHEYLLSNNTRIEIQDLWQHLTSTQPAAVIQGYPGMGKSTLLLRLTLHMAQRARGSADPLTPPLAPVLVPILISLNRYASFRQQAQDKQHISIWQYLKSAPAELDELEMPGMLAWLGDLLIHGQCLVLFDGLDEVSNARERFEVQEAIKAFIIDTRSKAHQATGYNRFLITSRVAGYDQNAFPNYTHYTLAELTPGQIADFLPRWFRASVRDNTHDATPEEVEKHLVRQATTMENNLNKAIQNDPQIQEMVQNPFLLTLLAIIQQSGINLPNQRIELYKLLIRTLLETRNTQRGLPEISEVQAIQRLGPVAFQMQGTRNSFMTRGAVLASFVKTITYIDKLPARQAQKEAEIFLDLMRERGGIFVLRTGDYYGFLHRSFQEYFAARHILELLDGDPDHEIAELISKARQQDDLWREPFLLAVAYRANNGTTAAWQLLSKLLTPVPETTERQLFHDLALTATCLLEAKDLSYQYDIVRSVLLALLALYEQAKRTKQHTICEQIEDTILRLLHALPRGATRSALLLVLQACLLDSQEPARQRTTLTILILIAQKLSTCPPLVFEMLVPPLLGLAQLTTTGGFQPQEPATPPDLDVIDLALVALSFLGAHGPAATSLSEMRPDFARFLPQLAYSSLHNGMLITPVVVPRQPENYRIYRESVDQWQRLYSNIQKSPPITQADETTCTRLQTNLLASAEEVCYPCAIHFLHMLQRSAERPVQPDHNWAETWQTYLGEQMNTGSYVAYQTSALLWATLFPQKYAQEALVALLLSHLHSDTLLRRNAQRFLRNIVFNLRTVNDVRDVRNLRFFRDLLYSLYFVYLNELRYTRDFSAIRETSGLRASECLDYLNKFRDSLYTRGTINLIYLNPLRDPKYFENFNHLAVLLLTRDFTAEIVQRLLVCADEERAELITLLLGRILRIRRTGVTSPETQEEMQQFVQAMLPLLQASSETRDAVLDVIRYLPANVEHEVIYLLKLASNTQDRAIQQACATALRYARPMTDAAWAALEKGQSTNVEVIREAIEERLKQGDARRANA